MSQQPGTTSFGLMRICGAIGFGLGVVAAITFARRFVAVELGVHALSELDSRQIVVVVGAVLVGLVGLLMGQGFGGTIVIRSDGMADAIDTFWHFTANFWVAWVMISGVLFSLVMGQEEARALFETAGMRANMVALVGLPLAFAWTLAITSWASVQLLPHFFPVPMVAIVVNFGPLFVAAAYGVAEAAWVGIHPAWGLTMALVPILALGATIEMIKKDHLRRLGS